MVILRHFLSLLICYLHPNNYQTNIRSIHRDISLDLLNDFLELIDVGAFEHNEGVLRFEPYGLQGLRASKHSCHTSLVSIVGGIDSTELGFSRVFNDIV